MSTGCWCVVSHEFMETVTALKVSIHFLADCLAKQPCQESSSGHWFSTVQSVCPVQCAVGQLIQGSLLRSLLQEMCERRGATVVWLLTDCENIDIIIHGD